MAKQLGDRLPQWTPEDIALVHGSNDFYGMNHYCAQYIRSRTGAPDPNDTAGNLDVLLEDKNGNGIGPETQSSWLRPYPLGFRKLLKWLSDRYGYPKIYVTENGTSLKGENGLPLDQLLDDDFRAQYFRDYIGAMADAYTLDCVDVRAYMAWSLLEYVPPHPPSHVRILQSTKTHFALVILNGQMVIKPGLGSLMLIIRMIRKGFPRRVLGSLVRCSIGMLRTDITLGLDIDHRLD